MKYAPILLSLLLLFSCKREFDAPLPEGSWDLFDDPAARPLPAVARQGLEGVYALEGGSPFGADAAGRWSYTATGTDTVFHFSIFCGDAVTYVICEGRERNGEILLHGYWRRLTTTETGRVRFTIAAGEGAAGLLSGQVPDSIVIQGAWGFGNATPQETWELRYLRPVYQSGPLEILAHRGGGRNADLLPASENSLEMLLLAARLGATGVEIDVQLTKDGIPVLYHDATLNERLVQKSGLVGPISNFTYDQLAATVRLARGGIIPQLREALQTIVMRTPLHFVWLDIKYEGPLDAVVDLQAAFTALAASMGRQVEIVIGIPDAAVYDRFRALPNHASIPSLCELGLQEASDINARIWAPTWTSGLQNDAVATFQSQGKRAFVWTLDIPQNIQRFMTDGLFNGILSNRVPSVAYYYYVQP